MNTLSMPLLSLVNEFLSARMGLNFAPQRWADLQRGLSSAAREFGFDDLGTFTNWLLSSPLDQEHIEVLASHLTIGETYFFREPQSFRMFEECVLPRLIDARRGKEQRLRIWSAGCSTGEEPYSLAIVLCRALPDLKNWDVTILATDINPHSLRRASEGMFGEWSFRDVPHVLKARYFTNLMPGRYEIVHDIKRLVAFEYLNLADDTYPSLVNNTNAMDVIFCRNVIIYQEPRKTQELIQKFRRCLIDDGWLFVGATETSQILFSDMKTVTHPGAIAYQKSSCDLDCWRENSADEYRTTCLLSSATRTAEWASPISEQAPPRESASESGCPHNEKPAEPLNQETFLQLARTHANRGELPEALALCDTAIHAEKLDPNLHYLRGTILQEQGQCLQAAAAFKRVLYLAPDFIMAHFALGYLAHKDGQCAAAEKHFDHALQLLRHYREDEVVPELEGITAGRLTQSLIAKKSQRTQRIKMVKDSVLITAFSVQEKEMAT